MAISEQKGGQGWG